LLDPKHPRVALEPEHLALEINDEVTMKPNAARHAARSASSRRALLPSTGAFDDHMEILETGLAQIPGFDLLPRSPCLRTLPLLRRREFRGVLEFTHVFIEEDASGGGHLEPSLAGLRAEPTLQVRGKLDAQRADAFAPDSGFHYHALYHGRGLRAVTMRLSEHGHRFAVTI
jgi:hypothetical protein